MTDERCIDCGLHVFDCECAYQECGEFRCTNDHRPDNRENTTARQGETREQRDERKAGA